MSKFRVVVNSTTKEKTFRRSRPEVFCKKGVPRNFVKFTGKHLCQSFFFNKACNFIKKEILAQMFSCEFYEISRNTFFQRTPLVATSGRYSVMFSWEEKTNSQSIKSKTVNSLKKRQKRHRLSLTF